VSRARLVASAIAFCCGIATARERYALLGAIIALAIAGTSAVLQSKDVRSATLAVALALLAGVTEGRFARPAVLSGDAHTTRVQATIVDERVSSLGVTMATLRLADGSAAVATFRMSPLPIGSRLDVRARREPFDVARNPGEPSLRDLEAERGVSWHLEHARLIAVTPPDAGDYATWLPRLRAWGSVRLHAELGDPAATILAGIMWGERGALPPELRDEFQDTGTVHVLVTAGLHLGVVAGVTYGALVLLGCGRRTACFGTIAATWAYAAFSGAHLPSLRAATMLSFSLLARALDRSALSWNALAAAAIVVAALRPASVTSLSFALSFSCVAAIFTFAEPLAAACARLGVPHGLREALGVALATQLGTWPLTAAAFLVIAPYAPLANAVVVPLVGGFALLAASPLPWLAGVVANVESTLLAGIVATVAATSRLPLAHVVATPPPPWSIAAYDVALGVAAFALRRQRHVAAAIVVLCASAVCLWPPRAPYHGLTVTAIDVGQADSLLVRTPLGHAFLVDGGGRLEHGPALAGASTAEDVGVRTVVPFLVRSGVHRLDAVLLSHPHGDHAGGVAPVLRVLGARAFADSGQRYAGHAYRDALDVARRNGVPILEPRGGDVWKTDDGVTFRFYGPTSPFIAGSRSDINSNSLVFRLEYGRTSVLFMGDAGRETEGRLLSRGYDLHADVLKVGHHG